MALLDQVLATEGLWLLLVGVLLAGLVRGFSGFGTAMVYMPFAAQVLPPVWVLITLIVLDIIGPAPAIPGALRDGQPRDVARLGLGAALAMPLGVLFLTSVPPEVFRYVVAIMSALLLTCLISGLRYRGPVPPALIYGTGGLAGVSSGAVGLGGPPVILLYMARDLPVAVIRANIMLFLVVSDLLMLIVFGLGGLLQLLPIAIGALLLPAYLATVWLGTWIFDPVRSSLYRWIAYAIIAVSVITGLPLWD